MILRSLRLRHGRVALPRPRAPIAIRRRLYATEIDQYFDRSDEPPPYDASNGPLDFEPQRTENPFAASQNVSSDTIPEGTQPSLPTTSHLSQDTLLRDPNHQVAQDWAVLQTQKKLTSHLGAAVVPHYRPHELLSNPPSPKDITLELLLASQSHLGHATSLWNPANSRYIFGVRDGIHIISLDVTASHLRRACKIVHGVTSRGGLVLFVGTRARQSRAVVKAAEMAGGYHLFDKWTPGSITNGQQILGRCEKRVVDEKDSAVRGFEMQLLNSAALKPDLVVCLNPLENYVLLHECGLNNIPTVGVIDTDANPTWVTYPIPANDDSLRCIQVIAGVLGRAGQEGQAVRLARAQRGMLSYVAQHRLAPPSEEDRARMKKEDDERKNAEAMLKSARKGMDSTVEGDGKSTARDPKLDKLLQQQRELLQRVGLEAYGRDETAKAADVVKSDVGAKALSTKKEAAIDGSAANPQVSPEDGSATKA